MKYMFCHKKYIVCLLLALLLGACQDKNTPRNWEGTWERTLYVPSHVQGRCVDEKMVVTKKNWQIKATLYPTFQCDHAFLELVYEGILDTVEIKNTNHQQFSFIINEIHLVEMVDILEQERNTVSGPTLKKLSERYVPKEFQTFRQDMLIDSTNNVLISSVYTPLLALVSEDYPNKNIKLRYQRKQALP